MVHPSRAIRGLRSRLLERRRIVVGVTGSIAAVEVPRIVRELIRHGAEVHAVMSPDAQRIITADALQFATGHPVVTALTGDVEHVTHMGPGEDRADLLLIAPATANTLSKIAHGIDDTAVTSFASVALGGGVPVLIAPAMHGHMGQNPAIRENLERLRAWGVGIVPPRGEENEEKLASPEEVAAAVLRRLARGPWAGRPTVVVGGASREAIDAVRSVTNESSGATAVAIATQAHYRGAAVELWLGAATVGVPSFLRVRNWRSVQELLDLARRESQVLRAADVIWVPAALSDFTLTPRPGKIASRDHDRLSLELVRAPKVLAELRRLAPAPTRLVGFKLEAASEDALPSRARALRDEFDLDWVVANDVSSLGGPNARVVVVHRDDRLERLAGSKTEVAEKLVEDMGRELAELRPSLGGGARSAGTGRMRHRPGRRRAPRRRRTA